MPDDLDNRWDWKSQFWLGIITLAVFALVLTAVGM